MIKDWIHRGHMSVPKPDRPSTVSWPFNIELLRFDVHQYWQLWSDNCWICSTLDFWLEVRSRLLSETIRDQCMHFLTSQAELSKSISMHRNICYISRQLPSLCWALSVSEAKHLRRVFSSEIEQVFAYILVVRYFYGTAVHHYISSDNVSRIHKAELEV